MSALVSHGKQTAFEQVLSSESAQTVMTNLGKDFIVSDELALACERFACSLYRALGRSCENVNVLQYRIFSLHAAMPSQLLPTADALRKHIQRANYQAAIWRRCLEQSPDLPSPHGNSWKVTENGIEVDWMDQPVAPKQLLSLTHCSCCTGCIMARYSCQKLSMKCTDACSCSGCKNAADVESPDEHLLDRR